MHAGLDTLTATLDTARPKLAAMHVELVRMPGRAEEMLAEEMRQKPPDLSWAV